MELVLILCELLLGCHVLVDHSSVLFRFSMDLRSEEHPIIHHWQSRLWSRITDTQDEFPIANCNFSGSFWLLILIS
ncbi:hypothetical protein MLD38_036492 [Melastoma candidum]|uniref:Uncharacterized protein n=1 Tax=Melastoma candidum TaxID=119954 RepID=A0ACB9LKF6_9MYRT|nr:hypothetical protein MLD38_036492 [Melastoma candidum]